MGTDAYKELSKLSDERLAYLIQHGSELAYTVIFNRYHKKTFALAYRMVGDYEAASDLSQDVLLKILLYIDNYNVDSKFFSWYYKILNNHCINYVRRYNIISFIPFSEFQPHFIENAYEYCAYDRKQDDHVFNHEMINKAAKYLSQNHRLAFELCDIEEISNIEAAKMLGIPIGTLRSRLFYARKQLRKHIEVIVNSEIRN